MEYWSLRITCPRPIRLFGSSSVLSRTHSNQCHYDNCSSVVLHQQIPESRPAYSAWRVLATPWSQRTHSTDGKYREHSEFNVELITTYHIFQIGLRMSRTLSMFWWSLFSTACLEYDGSAFDLDENELQRRRLIFWELYTWDVWNVGHPMRCALPIQTLAYSPSLFQGFVIGRVPSIRLDLSDCKFPENDAVSGQVSGELGCMFLSSYALVWVINDLLSTQFMHGRTVTRPLSYRWR